MDARHKTIRASRFVSIDTIGPLPSDIGIKYIVVIIDTFARYVELFPKQEVTAMPAADALWRDTCRFTAPLEPVTDFGSQFVNDVLTCFFSKRRVSNSPLRYRTLKEKMVSSKEQTKRSTVTYEIFNSTWVP